MRQNNKTTLMYKEDEYKNMGTSFMGRLVTSNKL